METFFNKMKYSASNNKRKWIVFSLFSLFIVILIITFSISPLLSLYMLVIPVFTLVVLIFWWFCLPKIRREKTADEEVELSDLESGMPRRFSANDLESATKNFSQRLGGGGFGSVYEGSLAVKRLDTVSGQGKKEFLAEVKTIGSIHHFNLVRLLGFCAGNLDKLLVYEYMCNGSLDKWIFHKNNDLTLDWPTRRKIILHIAKGLSYLHQECSPRIIHFDIKPQNVLLDAEFNAKISDFGLARFIGRDQSQVRTRVGGTRGYMAPELITGRCLSEKVDVYSFGIVVLEILFRRKNLDPSQPELLVHLVRTVTEDDQLFDFVDDIIGDMLQNKEAAVKMMRLAVLCSMDDSRRRPSMSTVVKVLEDGLDVVDIVDDSLFTINPMGLSVDVSEVGSAPLLAEVLSGPR